MKRSANLSNAPRQRSRRISKSELLAQELNPNVKKVSVVEDFDVASTDSVPSEAQVTRRVVRIPKKFLQDTPTEIEDREIREIKRKVGGFMSIWIVLLYVFASYMMVSTVYPNIKKTYDMIHDKGSLFFRVSPEVCYEFYKNVTDKNPFEHYLLSKTEYAKWEEKDKKIREENKKRDEENEKKTMKEMEKEALIKAKAKKAVAGRQ